VSVVEDPVAPVAPPASSPAGPTSERPPAWLAAAPDTARSVLRAVRQVVAPVAGTVGGAGWVVLGTLVVAGWVARRLGWLEAWAVATVCAVLLVTAVAFVVGRSSYAVQLRLGEQRVVVGTRAMGEVVVTNVGRRATLPARIELPVGAGRAEFRLPRLAVGAAHDELFAVPTRRRGLVVLGPVSSVRGDPVGLLRRQVRWTDPHDLYVHPRTVSLDGASSGFLRDIEGLPTQDLSSSDIAFHALRDYVAGDDRRAIHWKTTVRTGRLVVRQFEETRRSHLVVVLSTAAEDYADDAEVELAVSAAASLGLQALREDKQLSVVTSEGRLRVRTPVRFLDAMSVVETGVGRPALAAAGRTAGAQVPDASVVVLVAGSTPTPSTLAAAAVHLPAGALTVAVQCVPGAAVARRTLGGLVVLQVGELAHLPQAMRRVEG